MSSLSWTYPLINTQGRRTRGPYTQGRRTRGPFLQRGGDIITITRAQSFRNMYSKTYVDFQIRGMAVVNFLMLQQYCGMICTVLI